MINRPQIFPRFLIMIIQLNYRSKITTFIDDNKALLRRMYGSLVKEEDIPEQPKTPASTSLFVRSVRNFGGPRFRRSVHEGFIEDLLIEESEEVRLL